MKSLKLFGLCLTLVLCSPLIARAQGVDESSPNLPPLDGHYVSPVEAHQIYSAATVDIFNIDHHGFDINSPPPGDQGTVSHEHFNSILDGDFRLGAGPINHFSVPAPVSVDVIKIGGPNGSPFGLYQTEMLQLDITLGGGVMIRESPTLQSLGLTEITPATVGFHINSFFDVFTELSIDGGRSWIPTDAPGHVDLVAPEPSSLALIAIGMSTGAIMFIRRRKRS